MYTVKIEMEWEIDAENPADAKKQIDAVVLAELSDGGTLESMGDVTVEKL